VLNSENSRPQLNCSVDENCAKCWTACRHWCLACSLETPATTVSIVLLVFDNVELIGTYNDEDIYLFDSSHSDGAEHKHKYSGHRNNATGHLARNVRLSCCGNMMKSMWHELMNTKCTLVIEKILWCVSSEGSQLLWSAERVYRQWQWLW